jgi:hypothetical protein
MDPKAGRNPMPGKPAADRRINIYIDGYNFYVPLSTMDEKHYELCWCDFLALGTALAKRLAGEHPHDFGGCRLGSVKYFTATIPYNMPKDAGGIERKHLWLDALHHHSGVFAGFDAVASAGVGAEAHDRDPVQRFEAQDGTRPVERSVAVYSIRDPPAPSTGAGALAHRACLVSGRTDSITR